MPFLLVKWPFSAKPKVMQSCIWSKFINSVYALVHFWTKFIQYECKVHDKTFFFSFLKHSTQISKPPPCLRTGSGYVYIVLTFVKLSSRVVHTGKLGMLVSRAHCGKGLSEPCGPVSGPPAPSNFGQNRSKPLCIREKVLDWYSSPLGPSQTFRSSFSPLTIRLIVIGKVMGKVLELLKMYLKVKFFGQRIIKDWFFHQ